MRVQFVLPLLFSGALTAQSIGTFSATGEMTQPRQAHSANLLHDGTVLIAGGFQLIATGVQIVRRPLATDTAELYNPELGVFTATGKLTAVRRSHSATLLPNGKVLIAGGYSASSALASAELYDPAAGAFIPTGSMNGSRAGHSATLLANGKVLIAGGYDGQTHYSEACKCTTGNVATAELYDPATEAFTNTGDMAGPLAGPLATLLSDGKVWITTGDDGPNLPAQLYDPGAGTFSDTGWRNATAQIAATVNLLASGDLLITENLSECDFNSISAALFDVSSSQLRDAGPMAYAICRPTGVTLSDGSVLISGGRLDRPAGRPAQVYDSVSGRFSRTGEMVVGRAYHTASLLPNGNVLIAGGCFDDCLTDTAASAEIYTPPVRKQAPVLLAAANPVRGGEIVELYLTGLLDNSLIPPQVAIGGRSAEVLFFGNAGGYPALNQVNVRVPDHLSPGRAVPVRLTYLGRLSNEVTIALQ